MYKSFSMELAGRTLTVDIGRVAKQANGAAFMHYGDTTVLSTATASDKPRDGIAVSYTHLDVYKRQDQSIEYGVHMSKLIDDVNKSGLEEEGDEDDQAEE